jgi:molybdate transport system substrate-binding protein
MILRTLALLCALSIQTVPAQAQTLNVFCAGALKEVVLELGRPFESRTGVRVQVLGDTAGALVKRIEAGQAFDVVIVTREGIDRLAGAGRVDPATRSNLADVGIGVGVKEGAPLPPIATVEQFRAAVLGARRIALIDPASGGSSGIYLDRLFRELGIAEAVRAKAVLVPGGLAGQRVASGEADLVLQQVSEIVPIEGVTLVGMLPDEIQNRTTYAAGVSQRSVSSAAAVAFLAELTSADAAALMRAKRMQPAH